jgi:hypothetical protein
MEDKRKGETGRERERERYPGKTDAIERTIVEGLLNGVGLGTSSR